MRLTISKWVAALAVVAASTAPAMACGGLFTPGACAPCSPCGPSYGGTGYGGYAAYEQLPDPTPVTRQYYYVNQGPTFSGPGMLAPTPTYQETALGWRGYGSRGYGEGEGYGEGYGTGQGYGYGEGYGRGYGYGGYSSAPSYGRSYGPRVLYRARPSYRYGYSMRPRLRYGYAGRSYLNRAMGQPDYATGYRGPGMRSMYQGSYRQGGYAQNGYGGHMRGGFAQPTQRYAQPRMMSAPRPMGQPQRQRPQH